MTVDEALSTVVDEPAGNVRAPLLIFPIVLLPASIEHTHSIKVNVTLSLYDEAYLNHSETIHSVK